MTTMVNVDTLPEYEKSQIKRALELGTVMTVFNARKSTPERRTVQMIMETRQVTFEIYDPNLAFLRFVVYEEDMFSDPNFLAHATYPIKGIKSGFRSVPLKNGYSEDIELASLLVFCEMRPVLESEEELYSSCRQLRRRQEELNNQLFLYDTHQNLRGANRDALVKEFNVNENQLQLYQEKCNRRLREKWFHKKVESRTSAEKLLQEYCAETGAKDGTFLVRESETFPNDYTLSFWRSGRVQHCRIRSTMENGVMKYYLTDNLTFNSIYALIQHYREAHLRCLRAGCRCIELDCWDGPDGKPIIYHGWTRTTKIKFDDVVQAIRDHAFVTSSFPVILSIEEHCSVEQQRHMAKVFKEVLGDMLLTKPTEASADQLPSPSQLREKIIIKHKKLGPKGDVDVNVEDKKDEHKPQGELYMWDSIDQKWTRHYCAIADAKLSFGDDIEQAVEEEPVQDTPPTELHFGEKWFYS